MTRGLLYGESAVGNGDNLRKAVNNLGNMVEGMTEEQMNVVMGCILEVEELEKQVGWLSEAQIRAITGGLLYGESAVGNGRDNVRQILGNLENMLDDMTVEQKSHIASCIVSGKPDILGTPEKEVGYMSEAQMRAMTRGLLYSESNVGNPEKEVGWLSEAQMRAMTRGLLYAESAVGNGDNLRKAVNNLGNMVEDMTEEQMNVVMGCILEVEELEKQVGWLS